MTTTKSIEQEAVSTLRMLEKKDPGLKRLLNKAYGYAVFPSVGKASLVVGGSYGKGAVFAKGKFIGYATIGQTTIGVQIGGDTFTEVIVFKDRKDFDNMKRGKLAFAADASAVLVKAGAAAARGFGNGTRAFVYGSGGMLIEAAIGGQKFNFKPAGAGQKEMGRGQEEQDEDENQEPEDSTQKEGDSEEGEEGDEGDEEGTDLATRAAGAVRSTWSGVTDFVKGHPVAAGAIGVGVLAGGTILVMRWMNSSDQSEDQQDSQDEEGSQQDEQQGDEEMSADDQDSDQDQGNEEEKEAPRSRGNGRRRRYANA